MFDNIQNHCDPIGRGPIPPRPNRRGDFTFSLTVLATAVMKADGWIMRSELDYVKTFLIRNFGIEATREAMQMIKELSNDEISLSTMYVSKSVSRCLKLLKYNCSHFPFGIAKADGNVSTAEIGLLENISTGWASIMSLSCP